MRNVRISKRKNNCRCKRRNRENRRTVRMANSNCQDSISINTAGVNNELNLKLLEFKECPLEIVTDSGWRKQGKTHDIGIDYVDILATNGLVYTVLKDKIDHICWLKEDCKPHHHNCRNHHDCEKGCCRKDCRCKKHGEWEKDCHGKNHHDRDKECHCKNYIHWDHDYDNQKQEDRENHCSCNKHDEWDKHCHCKKHHEGDKDCDNKGHNDCKKECDGKKHDENEKH